MTAVMKRIGRYFTSPRRFFFLKLLFKLDGGIWGLLAQEFVCFIVSYMLISVLYHFILFPYPEHRKNFESFLDYIIELKNMVPLSFLLGFFVSVIIQRWWDVIIHIPRLQRIDYATHLLVLGDEGLQDLPRKRFLLRRTILRYLNIAWIFAFIQMSPVISSRFSLNTSANKSLTLKKIAIKFARPLFKRPKTFCQNIRHRIGVINRDGTVLDHFRPLITDDEILKIEKQVPRLNRLNELVHLDYKIPLLWLNHLLVRAKHEGLIADTYTYTQLVSIIDQFRCDMKLMFIYKEVTMPLIYTQVVVFIVYSFVMTEIFAVPIDQNKSTHTHPFKFQTYLPILTILKYVLYMGWFKVGLSLIYPFDGKSPDIPLNSILNENLKCGYFEYRSGSDIYPDSIKTSLDGLFNLKEIPFEESYSDEDNLIY